LIVPFRRECQWRPAPPASHHLRREQLCFRGVRRVRLQILPEQCHPLMQLAEHSIGTVAAEDVRNRHRRETAGLVAISEHEFAGLEWLLLRIRSGNSASLDRRMAYPIFESKGFFLSGKSMAVLTPDRFDSRQLLVCFTAALQHVLQALLIRSN